MPVIVNDAIIGNHVRSARKAKKLSQSACAALMNISVSYFGRIERGVVRLNLERLIEISNLLDVPITTLLDHCSQNVDTEAAPPSEDARIEQLLEMFRVAGPETADLMFALCETTFGKMEHRRKQSKK